MRYVGIDPGTNESAPGGIAYIDDDGSYGSVSMPRDTVEICREIRKVVNGYESVAAIERQWARPRDGRSSLFKLATNYGEILGVLAALDVDVVMVTPAQWKKDLSLASDGSSKENSLAMARALFPNVSLKYKKNHGIAEALLIAKWVMTNSRIDLRTTIQK